MRNRLFLEASERNKRVQQACSRLELQGFGADLESVAEIVSELEKVIKLSGRDGLMKLIDLLPDATAMQQGMDRLLFTATVWEFESLKEELHIIADAAC